MKIQRGAAASTFHKWLEGFLSGRNQCWETGTSQLKWDWDFAHTSLWGYFLPSGNEAYEEPLEQHVEHQQQYTQRKKSVVGKKTQSLKTQTLKTPNLKTKKWNPCLLGSGIVVRTAAAPFGTCHPLHVTQAPCSPQQLLGALVALGTSLLSYNHGSPQHCP